VQAGASGEWEGLAADGLAAYLERIGFNGDREPTLATLQALHLAHVTSIPFENIDIQLGLPVHLDLASLGAKLVQARRGGYCFEHNTLFAAALEALGFPVARLAGRVGPRGRRTRSLTHMLLAVQANDARWLADVGFGGNGLLLPLPLDPGPPVQQYRWRFRIEAEGPLRVLQALDSGEWLDLYSFTLEERYPIDYVVANHYTSTHPDSIFVRTLTVQLPGPAMRLILRNRELIESYPDREADRTAIEDDAALLHLLAERFAIELPAGTRFRSQQ
jgi:N-hydroxyarylamine O-acetyltransferase